MYYEHKICSLPDENTKVWRFLDFTKLYSLLDKEKLHFSRVDQLNDRFEGSIPKSKKQFRITQHFEHLKGVVPDSIIKMLENSPPLLYTFRKLVYICSFHLNEYESAALWKIYLKSNEGVVFQTTIKNLKNSFNCDDKYNVLLSDVEYIDYSSESYDTIPIEKNVFHQILYKRKSFEYERELRAFVIFPPDLQPEIKKAGTRIPFNPETAPKGVFVPVDLGSLILDIRVAPTSSEWFKELVQSMVDKFGLKIEVHQSSLAEEPLF